MKNLIKLGHSSQLHKFPTRTTDALENSRGTLLQSLIIDINGIFRIFVLTNGTVAKQLFL